MRALWPLVLLLAACGPVHRYPDGRGLEGQLEREVEALQQTVRSMEYQLSICGQQGPPDRIYADLHQVFTNTEVGVDRRGMVTIVSIPGNHVFRPESTTIRDEALMSLDLLATALNLHPDYRVTIEGHTDDREPAAAVRRQYPTSWELSYGRASSVMRTLVDRFRVAESRFSVVARGPHQPIATNDTSAGQAQNRRIVLYIYPPGIDR